MRVVLMLVLLVFSTSSLPAQEYRTTITIFVQNGSGLPNRVQVRDMEAHYGIPEDCRIAKAVAGACSGRGGRGVRPNRRDEISCAAAQALVAEPRCSIKDLIFDDWIDGGMKVPLEVHTGIDGLGLVGVRAVNNTDSWTFKPGLRNGDTVNHQ